VRKEAHQRAEPAERERQIGLVEEADRGGGARVGIVRCEAGGVGCTQVAVDGQQRERVGPDVEQHEQYERCSDRGGDCRKHTAYDERAVHERATHQFSVFHV